MNRKGFIKDNIISIGLVIIFLLAILFFLNRTSDFGSFYAQAYAKKIAMMINSAESGMTIIFDGTELYEYAKERGYDGNLVEIDGSLVIVRMSSKLSRRFEFFNNVVPIVSFDKTTKKITVSIT